MIFTKTEIPDVWIIEPDVFGDNRGYFMEAYKKTDFISISDRVISCRIMNHVPQKTCGVDFITS